MTQGEGLIGLLYALKGLLEAGVIWVITGAGVLAFFLLVVNYIAGKYHLGTLGIPGIGKDGHGLGGGGHGVSNGSALFYALVLLFVIFGIYSLIALTGAVLGVNNGPAGGLIIR